MLAFIRSWVIVAAFALVGVVRADDPNQHWAWQAPKRPVLAVGLDDAIDKLVDARLGAAGLRRAPPASRQQLLRRATLDVTGLPPTPEEVEQFVNDKSPDAWEKVVDRLLASPHYGERWARHWLDLARYADTNGYEHDEVRPDAWRYRDYVIQSFNADKPFHWFIIEQLAGDEAFPGNKDALVATAFNLLGPDMTDSADQAQRRQNTLNDMTDTAGLVFLGMTMACARCHDHKFEPITTADYYRLQAFFAPADFRTDLSLASARQMQAHKALTQSYLEMTKELREEIAGLEGPVRSRIFENKLKKLSPEAQAAHRVPAEKRNGGEQELVAETKALVGVSANEIIKGMKPEDATRLKGLQAQLKKFDGKKPAPLPVTMGLKDRPGPPPKTAVLERGELANAAAEVDPGFPAVLLPNHLPAPAAIEATKVSHGRRLALANWIISPENPLTGRVIVNRLWQHHFGRGIVRTASDFGVRGDRPSDQQLLDYLATEFVNGGWTLKRMHKLILMSQTYQQSTQVSPEAAAKDPDNRLWSRMNRVRLEGEAVRDSLLAISGRLNPATGGPGVVTPELAAAGKSTKSRSAHADTQEHNRRSVYLFVRRNLRHPFLEAFDAPDSNLSCPNRERSTTAPQALALLNATEANAAAKALAERLENETASQSERIERLYRLALARRPTAAEQERAREFLQSSPLSELCRAVVNLNEFVYRE